MFELFGPLCMFLMSSDDYRIKYVKNYVDICTLNQEPIVQKSELLKITVICLCYSHDMFETFLLRHRSSVDEKCPNSHMQ